MRELRVWWIPQVPMKPFILPVASLVQAKLILYTLAEYDKFQFVNRVKGDYCNIGGLHVMEDGDDGPEWVDWYDDDGNEIDDLTMEQCALLDAGVKA